MGLQLLPLVLRRLRTYAPLLLPVLLGSTVAAATMASIVIYTQALRDLGLSHAVNNADERSLDLEVHFRTSGIDREVYERATGRVHSRVTSAFDGLAEREVFNVRSSTFLVPTDGSDEVDLEVTPRSIFHVLESSAELLAIEGRMPEPGVVETVDGVATVEAVAMRQGAEYLNLSIGDTVPFVPFWEDRNSKINVRLTGLASPVDPEAHYWDSPALQRIVREPTLLSTLPVIIPQATLVDVVGTMFVKADGSFYSRYLTNPADIRAADSERFARAIASLNSSLGASMDGYRQNTELDDVLNTYDTRIRFIEAPIAIMLFLVTAMVLYAIVFLAGLVTDRQRADAALLRSRGARTPQVLQIYAVQGFLVTAAAAAAAPFLAAGLIASVGYLPVFSSLGDGGPLRVSVSPLAFGLAGVGGLLAFAVLLIPTLRLARRNLLEERRLIVRPNQVGFVQRYYLDVGLAAAGLIFLWQLGQQGSLVADTLSGQQGADLFLLLIPTLFLLSAGLLLLRVLPLIGGLVARIAAPVSPTWLALGLWQVGRNPLSVTRLVLLLVLAAGLGAFAASFGGTLDRSYEERARYEAGADARVANAAIARNQGPTQDMQALVESPDGVAAAARVFRASSGFAAGSSTDRFEVLAIDAQTLKDVTWWRDDFASNSLDETLDAVDGEAIENWGIELPEDARYMGVWVRSANQPDPRSFLRAVLEDANGRFFTISLGTLESTDWTYMETRLEPLGRTSFGRRIPSIQPAAPFTLVSLQVRQRSRSEGMSAGAFFVDEIMTRTAAVGSEPVSVRRFTSNDDLAVIQIGPLTRTDSLRVIGGAGRDEGPSLLFSWGRATAFVQRGFYVGPQTYELPMLVSPGILRASGLRVGDTLDIGVGSARVPGTIVGVVDFFPTLNPTEGAGYVITEIQGLLRHQNLVGQGQEEQANEVWYRLDEGLAGEERTEALEGILQTAGASQIIDREDLIATSQADPLVAAGWGALLLVAYGAVLFLGGTCFVAHSILTVGERGRQFALLRTMGLNGPQIRAVVWFEHMLVVGIGIGAGFLIGQRTGALLMPFLDRTQDGVAVLPPYVIETSAFSIGIVYALMAVVFIAATAFVVRMYNTLALGQTLRIGED
ncbi:MAG: ABC transporter permease [Chloroflexi bacterium]|nr:ABC transporter permease [Chloroflexota bacterium]